MHVYECRHVYDKCDLFKQMAKSACTSDEMFKENAICAQISFLRLLYECIDNLSDNYQSPKLQRSGCVFP